MSPARQKPHEQQLLARPEAPQAVNLTWWACARDREPASERRPCTRPNVVTFKPGADSCCTPIPYSNALNKCRTYAHRYSPVELAYCDANAEGGRRRRRGRSLAALFFGEVSSPPTAPYRCYIKYAGPECPDIGPFAAVECAGACGMIGGSPGGNGLHIPRGALFPFARTPRY